MEVSGNSPEPNFLMQKRNSYLLAEAVSIGVKTVFLNHLYQFAGKTYMQRKGYPIGVRLSCAVARMVMNMWDRKLKTILDTNKLQLEEVFRYLDDWRGIMKALKAGWRWDRGQLRFRQAWSEEDSKVSVVVRTALELNKMMDSVYGNLKVKMEHEEQFEYNTLPTLDFSPLLRLPETSSQ